MDKMSETYHSPSWHLDLKDNEIRNLRARVAELEAALKKIAALPSYIPATQAALIATEALNP